MHQKLSTVTHSNTIIINESVVSKLAASYQLQMNQPLEGDALQKEIDKYIKEEIYYQNALALSLDKDDVVIRRILKNKYEFIIDDKVDKKNYTEKELKEYYNANQANYIADSTLDFYQILFTNDQYQIAIEQLEKIKNENLSAETASKISSNKLLHHHYQSANSKLIKKTFGSAFTKQLFEQKVGQWLGPIKSGLGFHLIFINHKKNVLESDFDKVKAKVARDFLYQAKVNNEIEVYKSEQKKYKIKYDA